MAKTDSAHAEPRRFKVLHTQVGPWPKDFIATQAQLDEHGAEVQRLLDAKAIEVVTEPPTGPTPLVPDEVARQQAAHRAAHPVAPVQPPPKSAGVEAGASVPSTPIPKP